MVVFSVWRLQLCLKQEKVCVPEDTRPADAAQRLSAEPSDTVVLDVRGMKCGGCSAAVRRILLADPAVESVAVNLLTESAVVRLHSSAVSSRHRLQQLLQVAESAS